MRRWGVPSRSVSGWWREKGGGHFCAPAVWQPPAGIGDKLPGVAKLGRAALELRVHAGELHHVVRADHLEGHGAGPEVEPGVGVRAFGTVTVTQFGGVTKMHFAWKPG